MVSALLRVHQLQSAATGAAMIRSSSGKTRAIRTMGEASRSRSCSTSHLVRQLQERKVCRQGTLDAVAGFDWISLCTDYGCTDGFVAACHGVIARIARMRGCWT